MNTYKDPEYRGYYLGKVAAAVVVLLLVAVAAARYRDMSTAPAAAPATPVVESAVTAVGSPEAIASPATETPGTDAIATGAPTLGAALAAGTAAVRMMESPVPIAVATDARAGVTSAAPLAVQALPTGAAEKYVAVSGTVSTPTAAGTSSLLDSGTTMGAPSDNRTHTVSGGHLMANINMNAPNGFEISTDDATPIITVSTISLSAFSTLVGTPSTAQTYTVSGSDLTADISINAPAGFEISEDGRIYSSYLTLTQSGGTVATTTIYVRLTGAAEGSYSGNITHTSVGALATATPGVTQAPAPGKVATAPPAPGATEAAAPGKLATAAPSTTVISPAAATETDAVRLRLTVSHVVVGKAGQVTLMGMGEPNAPIEVVQGSKVIGKVVVQGDGTWSYTYLTTPGAQIAAVQYEGDAGSRSVSMTFTGAATPVGAGAAAATPAPASPSPAAPQAAAATSAAPSRTAAPTPAVTPQAADGQAYIVQVGDYLRTIALRFYGDETQWPLIYDATNARAARDASFAVISDPNVIMPGWKLWIPGE